MVTAGTISLYINLLRKRVTTDATLDPQDVSGNMNGVLDLGFVHHFNMWDATASLLQIMLWYQMGFDLAANLPVMQALWNYALEGRDIEVEDAEDGEEPRKLTQYELIARFFMFFVAKGIIVTVIIVLVPIMLKGEDTILDFVKDATAIIF